MHINELGDLTKKLDLQSLLDRGGQFARQAEGSLLNAGVYDINVSADTSTPHIIKAPTAAIGFGGHLPPGAMLFLAHESDAAAMLTTIGYHVTATTNNPGQKLWGNPSEFQAWSRRIIALAPGDVIRFAEPVRGLAVLPWLSQDPYNDWLNSWYKYPALATGAIPMPMARIRVWEKPGLAPDRIAYHHAPVVHLAGNFSAEPSTLTQGVELAPVPCTVTLHFFADGTTPPTHLAGGHTSTWEVWWLTPAGIWAHNPDDDLDSAGRQPVTEYHDSETYAVPGNASRVYVRALGTSADADCAVIVSAPAAVQL